MRKQLEYIQRGFSKSARTLIIAGLSMFSINLFADELCTQNFSSASTIDGIVAPGVSTASCAADTLWPQVGPAEFQPGGSNPAAYLRVAHISSTNRLRVGIDVSGDPDVSNQDVVLLFFDANNSNTWDATDFALRIPVSPSNVVIDTGDQCDLATGTVEYFQYNAVDEAWDANPTAAAEVTARYAYDYTAPDPEDKIWNLEFDLPIHASNTFQLTTSGNYFAVGGYLFADDGHEQSPQLGFVRAWPGGVVVELTGLLPAISSSTPQLAAPVASTLGNINLEDVCFDVNFSTEHSWQINGVESESGDNHINKTGNNRFRIGYYFDGPGVDLQPISNPGTVRMGLTPFRAGAWQWDETWNTNIAVNSTPYNFNQLHMSDEVTLNFPGEFGTTNDVSEVCADLDLLNFQMDDDSSNNDKHINHNYFSTSSYEQTVALSVGDIKNLKAGETANVWLNIENNNEHPDVINYVQASDKVITEQTLLDRILALELSILILLLAVFILLIILLLVYNKNNRIKILIVILLILMVFILIYLLSASRKEQSGSESIDTPRWSILNAGELKITPIDNKPGWYQVPLVKGESKRLKLKFNGQPLLYETQHLRLEPSIEGAPNKLDIPVKQGQILTVIATGKTDVDGENGPLNPTMAGGFTEPRGQSGGERSSHSKNMLEQSSRLFGNKRPFVRPAKNINADATVTQTETAFDPQRDGVIAQVEKSNYPLTEGYYQPNQFSGALSGWFHGDGNSSGAFVVGRATSIIVPDGVSTLSLFVNAQWESYATISGFYDLIVVTTQAPTVPTRTVPGGDATYQLPIQIQPWLTLTSVNMYTYFPQEVVIGNRPISTTLQPLGDAHFSIYESHVDRFDANFNQKAGVDAAIEAKE